ncbi:MAG TPA: zinc ABC transporter substrate-binding protein [Magnetospirillaceae bacterium]|nr:zinc ABC transporter substrate-binding protein [Magnetospirillaceae bacterium]
MKHNLRSKLIIGGAVALVLVLLGAAFLAPRQIGTNNKLKLVAAENFWGSVAAQIGGDRVEVTSIITDPEVDPHLYETGAKDASAITNADIVVLNGRGYDEFVEKLLAGSPRNNRVVITAADIINLDDNANPHLWYDLPRTGIIATQIEQELSKKDPAGSATYKANLDAFLDAMQPLLNKLGAISAAHAGAPVAYTERVPQYLIERANLTIKSPASFASAIEEGNEPSPADQAAMLELITKKQIRVLFYNAQAESLVTEKIRQAAEMHNIPVVAVTETIPPQYTTYQAWQLAQLDALWQALENTK